MEKVAQVISWIFLPLLMPVYTLLFVMFIPSVLDYKYVDANLYSIPFEFKKALLYIFTSLTIVFPGLSFIILSRSKLISSVEMDNKSERPIPILLMLAYCLILYIFLVLKAGNSGVPRFIFSLPLSGVFVTLVFYFLNKWKKVSIHAAGAGILTGFILAYILYQVEYELWVLIFSILISGLVMSARLYLKKHTLFEVVFGWIIATVITFGVNYFY